jgi:hypothetical protein
MTNHRSYYQGFQFSFVGVPLRRCYHRHLYQAAVMALLVEMMTKNMIIVTETKVKRLDQAYSWWLE